MKHCNLPEDYYHCQLMPLDTPIGEGMPVIDVEIQVHQAGDETLMLDCYNHLVATVGQRYSFDICNDLFIATGTCVCTDNKDGANLKIESIVPSKVESDDLNLLLHNAGVVLTVTPDAVLVSACGVPDKTVDVSAAYQKWSSGVITSQRFVYVACELTE